MTTIDEIMFEYQANPPDAAPEWRRGEDGEWTALLNGLRLSARRRETDATAYVWNMPAEDSREAYAVDLGNAMDLAARIALKSPAACHCSAGGDYLCCCGSRCAAKHCACGEHSAADCPRERCFYCCQCPTKHRLPAAAKASAQ